MEKKHEVIKPKSEIELKEELWRYNLKRWQESRGKKLEFDVKKLNKYQAYYDEIENFNKQPDQLGVGVEQLEEPFISMGLAFSREEIAELIDSVDDDKSGRIEFGEFLKIVNNKKKDSGGKQKITNFFKNLANNKVSKDKNLNYFSFKTLIVALRRNNLLKAFDAKKSEAERNEGLKTLKAYKNMLELKGDMGGSKKNRSKSYFNKNLLNQL
jgi:Ca2+-binding EF-hand superfamily protein